LRMLGVPPDRPATSIVLPPDGEDIEEET
jgi:hypothetical protein